MSQNLNYCDLWHELYSYLREQVSKATGESLYEHIIDVMEIMDPRLQEEERQVQELREAVDSFFEP